MSYQTMTSVADVISSLPHPYPPVNLTKHYKGTTLNQQGLVVTSFYVNIIKQLSIDKHLCLNILIPNPPG